MSQAADSRAQRVRDIPYPAATVGWYATSVFAFLYWIAILDRFILSLLVGPMKEDLGLTDVQIGMLHGFVFMITFAGFGLVAGVLADRLSRRWVMFAGAALWSLATAFCGLATSYWHLVVARLGLGAGQTTLNPCATSMLADLFPRERLTLALQVFSIGATLGSGTAYLLGGAIVQLVYGWGDSFTLPVLGEVRAWQAVFLILGLPGVLLALLIFTLPEPVRRGVRAPSEGARPMIGAYAELLKFMRPRLRFFVCHYTGFGLASAVIVGGAAWYPVHMARNFGWSPGEIGAGLGMTLLISGVVGKLISGQLVDAMYKRGRRDAHLRWYAWSMLAAVPLGLTAMTSANPYVFLVAVGCMLMLLSPMPALQFGSLALTTPNELRGTQLGFFSATSSLIGAGSGPVLVAATSDLIFRDEAAIGLAMATVIAIAAPLGALALALGCRPMREAAAEAETW